MQAYQDVFSALLRLRRAAAVLDELWKELVLSPGTCDASSTMSVGGPHACSLSA